MSDNSGAIGFEKPTSQLSKLLNSYQSIQIEIGCGSGRFLYNVALNRTNTYFIGIDLNDLMAARAMERVSQLDNAFVLNAEAFWFVNEHVNSSTIDEYHIYFPSPYNKSKWLITESFVNELYRTLKPGASLRIITDQTSYFHRIYDLFNNLDWLEINWSNLDIGQPSGYLIGSYCEQKYGSKHSLQLLKQ